LKFCLSARFAYVAKGTNVIFLK